MSLTSFFVDPLHNQLHHEVCHIPAAGHVQLLQVVEFDRGVIEGDMTDVGI